jgi:hypothetical protein
MVRKVERILPPLRMRSNKTLSALEYFSLERYRGLRRGPMPGVLYGRRRGRGSLRPFLGACVMMRQVQSWWVSGHCRENRDRHILAVLD